MAKNSGMPESIKTVMMWALGIGIIALILLIMIIIFGNLSGNLGFIQDTNTSIRNETINLTTTGEIPASADNKIGGLIYDVTMTNATGDTMEIVDSGNYTITGVVINASTTSKEFVNKSVNVTYSISYDSQAKIDSDGIIINYTTSAVNTSKQLPVTGTILGIAILLAILIGILVFAIRRLMNVTSVAGGGGGSSGFDGGGGKSSGSSGSRKFRGSSSAELG